MRQESVSVSLEETFRVLSDECHRRLGKIPSELMAAQVLAMTGGADFAVRRASLEAIVRRYRFAHQDELKVKTRPPGGRVLGTYTTSRRSKERPSKAEPRPYLTLLASLIPLRGSCSCSDFARSSLGVCKHLLVVLNDTFSRPAKVSAARREQGAEKPVSDGLLTWLPILPLNGALDRTAGLRLRLPTNGAPAPSGWVALERGSPKKAARLALGPESTKESTAAWALAGAGAVSGENPHVHVFAPDPRVLANLAGRFALLKGLRDAFKMEPAAETVVAEEGARAERRLQMQKLSARALSRLTGVKRKLYPYQRDGVARFLEVGRLVLADDMGLGKTTQAVAACHALYHEKAVRRGILIVPASLKAQWRREWEDTTDVPITVVDGSKQERIALYRKLKTGFVVIGYEQLLKDFEEIRALGADMVVLDEAQRIKNWATKTSVYVKALTPQYRLVLTGTPMENRLEELASILDWVDDVALAPKWRLEPFHTVVEADGSRGKGGAKNLGTLRTRLEPCLLRRVRQDVLADLPSRTDTRVPVPMTAQQQEEHDALTPSIASLLARRAHRPLTQAEFLKLMQLLTVQRMISNGLGQVRFDSLWPTYKSARPDEALLEGLLAPKLIELRRLVEELAVRQERKIVVFSQWRRMLKLAEWSLRDVLGDRGLRVAFFTGAESQAMRTRSIVDFHDEPAVRVLLLTDAGGVGLNLQRAASACINLELPWNPAVLEQRIGRIYRLGQKRPIDVYNLVTEYGIEARIAEIIAHKKAVFSGLFDGTSDEVRFDGARGFLSDVEKLVAPGPELQSGAAPAVDIEPGVDDLAASDDFEPASNASSGELGAWAGDVRKPFGSLESPSDALAAHTAAANGSDGSETTPATESGATPGAASVAELFAQVRVKRSESGAIAIEAPPEAAASLLALFEGMARLVRDGLPRSSRSASSLTGTALGD